MMTLIQKLEDLHKQATMERSHCYTASVIEEAMTEIKRLNKVIDSASNALMESAISAGLRRAEAERFAGKLRALKSE